jgi:transposase
MKHPTEDRFAAVIGIDWAHAKHDLCLRAAGSEVLERSVLKHSPEAIDDWVRELRARFGQGLIAVALELDKGPLVYALQKYEGFVLFPVNPTTLAKYREAFTPSGAKDDPTDAELALQLLLRHPEALKGLEPQSPSMRALVQLVHDRRRLVSDKDTVLFCDFLTRWPTLKHAKRARRSVLEAFFHEHNVRRSAVIDERIGAIRSALSLTADPGVIGPQSLLAATLVSQLRTVLEALERFNAAIVATTEQLPDYAIFSSFPGAGPTFAPRLLAAFGENRERYQRCEELQKYSGIAPVTERSGQKSWVHWRYRAPSFLRQTFVEWAGETIPRSFWAKTYYQQQRAKGLSHQAALRSLAFKWIRILFRCWQDRTPYDEAAYLIALQRSGSPLLKTSTAST